jgi:hypothetical protein
MIASFHEKLCCYRMEEILQMEIETRRRRPLLAREVGRRGECLSDEIGELTRGCAGSCGHSGIWITTVQ